jgi:outer membrane protein assembly factor BamB
MMRLQFAGALSCLFLVAGVLLAVEDPDPEPPKPRAKSSATSGDYVVKVDNNGMVSASNKRGQLLWRTHALKAQYMEDGQVIIAGDHVAVLHGGNLFALDLRSGKLLWNRFATLPKGKLSVKGDRVTVAHKGKREAVDLKTGKLLEAKR